VESWPLVGRDRLIEDIERSYATQCNGVVMLGEAGVGKTRLAREAVARLSRSGCASWSTIATRSASGMPLGALAPLPAAGDPPPDNPIDVMTAMATPGDAVPEPRPVVAIDDAHLLDDASAALVFRLAAEGRAFFILTARACEPVPDAVTALWMMGLAQRIEVPPLADDDIDALFTAELGAPMDAVSRSTLRRQCEGSPLLLRELLMAGRESGCLRQHDGVWRWEDRGYITARLSDVVRARMGELEPALLALGELLAFGEALPLPMVEDLACRAAVEVAERRGLVKVTTSGSRWEVRLEQALFGPLLRATTPRSREQEVWRQLAQAAERSPMRRSDDIMLAAKWRQRAGRESPPDLLLAGAARASERLDLDLAEELAGLAHSAGAGPRAELTLAETLARRGRYADAARVLPATADCMEAPDRSRWKILRQWIHYLGNSEQPLGPPDDERDATALAAYAWLLVAEGRNAQALSLSREVLMAAPDASGAVTRAAAVLLVAAGLLGRPEPATGVLSIALAAAEHRRDRHPLEPTEVAAAGCVALVAMGELSAAQMLAERSHQAAVETVRRLGRGAAPAVGACAAAQGIVAKAQGRAVMARSALSEAAALLAGWPTEGITRVVLAELAATHALLGDVTSARERLSEADRLDAFKAPVLTAWVERARAWVTAAEGDLPGAAGQALRAGTLARDTQQPTIEALATYDAARFGDTSTAHVDLARLAAELDLDVVAAMAAVAKALRSPDAADDLDASAHWLAVKGHILYAAEAATVAHARHLRAGRRTAAAVSLRQARELELECGEDVHSPLLSPTTTDTQLTPRELQIARLAAAGHSAPKIAARFGLSPRTVNNHLGRAYDKLGITGRTQLRNVLTTLIPSPGPHPTGFPR
jgi:DNA-binding CsgD family transcriptional regulator